MHERAALLTNLLADEHGVWLPLHIIRAELARYLTDCASLFRISRMEAQLLVTDAMLHASARELANQYRPSTGERHRDVY